jgi:hypothetical protein
VVHFAGIGALTRIGAITLDHSITVHNNSDCSV